MVERIQRHLGAYAGPFSPIFLTVTAPGSVSDRDEWNRTAPRRFAALMRTLRRGAMPAAEYARVLELQRRGLLHVHAIVTGWEFVPAHVIRAAASSHGFGRIEFKPVRSAFGLSRYLASAYLAKSHESLGRRYRVVQYSRGWAPAEADPDAVVWRQLLNGVDPVVAAIPEGMSWSRWFDWQIGKGRGSVVFSSPTGWARGSPPLFDDP